MDYELASQLKDAGFPQGGTGGWTFPPDKLVARHTDRVYLPALSELISACVADFQRLQKVPVESIVSESGAKWQALARGACEYGASPEEAVARLWLACNRKS